MRNNQMQHELNAYYLDIEKQLICSSKKKKKLISDLKCNIKDFIDDNPTSSIDDIIEHFGTPEDIADSYLSTLEGKELTTKFKRTRNIRKYVMLSLFIAVTVIISIGVYEFFDNHNYSQGHHEVVVNESINE